MFTSWLLHVAEVFEDKMYVHLVMEKLEGGQLIDSIISAGHYSEADAARVFRTMVSVHTAYTTCRALFTGSPGHSAPCTFRRDFLLPR